MESSNERLARRLESSHNQSDHAKAAAALRRTEACFQGVMKDNADLAAEIERLTAGIKALQATCCGDDPEKCHGCRALLGLLAAPESRDG